MCKSNCERAERMRMRRLRAFVRKRRATMVGRGQKGFVLIELLVSIAIFGVISVGFLSALVAGYHGVIVAHDVTTAESLTRTALEDIRVASYPMETGVDNVTTVSRYDVVVRADYVDTDLENEYQVVSYPSGIQMITVTVRHHESGRTIKVTNTIKVQPSS